MNVNELLIDIVFVVATIMMGALLTMLVVTFIHKIRPVFRNKNTIKEIKKNKLDLVDVYRYQHLVNDTGKGLIRFIGSFDHLLTVDEAMEYLKVNPYDTLAMVLKDTRQCYIYDMDTDKWTQVDGGDEVDTAYEIIGPYLEKTERIPLEDIDRMINNNHV